MDFAERPEDAARRFAGEVVELRAENGRLRDELRSAERGRATAQDRLDTCGFALEEARSELISAGRRHDELCADYRQLEQEVEQLREDDKGLRQVVRVAREHAEWCQAPGLRAALEDPRR